MFFTPEVDPIRLVSPESDATSASVSNPSAAGLREKSEKPETWTVKLDFVGADPDVRPVGLDEAKGVFSYFKGKPETWKTGVPSYSKIVYPNLWPGIDLIYYGDGQPTEV